MKLLILTVLLILGLQKPSFETRPGRWEPYDHVSPMDGVRDRGVILKADKPIAPGIYPTLVVGCHDKTAGIIVGLPGVAFGERFPSDETSVRLKWDQGVPVTERWTVRAPEFAFPFWREVDHLKRLETASTLMIEFKLYQLGMVWAEFDLTDKEAALAVARSCK